MYILMKFTINMNMFSLRVLATVILQEKTDEDTNVVYAVIFTFDSYFCDVSALNRAPAPAIY